MLTIHGRTSRGAAAATAVTLCTCGIALGGGAVTVTDTVDQGQTCFKVTTPSATYYFQKKAAGFSSILDRDGKDWISYRPGGGSAGEYRGIPNLGGCCHPGYGEGKGATMQSVLSPGTTKERAVIVSTSTDRKWKTTWEFYATHATLTVQKVGKKYWFLYEGTPYGGLDKKNDYYVNSRGEKKEVIQRSIGIDLPDPEWVYFFDDRARRSLLLVHHDNDRIKDNFWQMNGDMTVFGFGRTCKGVCMELSKTPKKFSIALVEETAYDKVKTSAESILRGDAVPAAATVRYTHERVFRVPRSVGRTVVYTVAGRRSGEAGPGIRLQCAPAHGEGIISHTVTSRGRTIFNILTEFSDGFFPIREKK